MRKGTPFSLIAFQLLQGDWSDARLAPLAKKLIDRIRVTDAAGWLPDGRIGVLLPHTNANGAECFVEDVFAALGQEASAVAYEVFSAPPSKPPGDQKRTDTGAQRSVGQRRDSSVEILHRYVIDPSATSTNSIVRDDPRLVTARPIEALPGFIQIPLWKRALDFLVASSVLLLASPVMLLTAAIIKVMSRGPVFYRQKRVGLGGSTFDMLKFRTMKVNNDKAGHERYLSTLINSDAPMKKLDGADKRIIPFGRIMRACSIDELPQLLNVLLGDMSLVGPRPCLPNEAEEYLRWHSERFDVPPGMTGLWQVSGKNSLTFREMVRLDITYSRNISLANDVKILLRTPLVVAGLAREAIARSGAPAPEVKSV
jgi:lipopolysaccharide/colanic/teichoic acid biosynthesis glycosyltransferase